MHVPRAKRDGFYGQMPTGFDSFFPSLCVCVPRVCLVVRRLERVVASYTIGLVWFACTRMCSVGCFGGI